MLALQLEVTKARHGVTDYLSSIEAFIAADTWGHFNASDCAKALVRLAGPKTCVRIRRGKDSAGVRRALMIAFRGVYYPFVAQRVRATSSPLPRRGDCHGDAPSDGRRGGHPCGRLRDGGESANQRANHDPESRLLAVGGKVLGDPEAQSLHCDHGYVDYQIPVNPRRINLVMWHSAAATAWLNRWDGGEGYQSLFLRRGFPVYIWDGPHVGRANWGCTTSTYEPGIGRDQQSFVAWRFGAQYPNWFEGVQFPTKDTEAWNQASRGRYLEFDTIENAQLQSDAAAKLMDRIGPSGALTNSAGGMRALLTALKTNNLAGIVMYENVGYLYPKGEGPGQRPGSVRSKCRSRSSRG